MSVPRPEASRPRTPPGRSVAAIARRAPGLSVNQWNAMLLTTASNPPSGTGMAMTSARWVLTRTPGTAPSADS